MDRVEVEGLEIAYERVGTGPPLVLLHGYVGDGATTWKHQLDGLSDEFTVVAWDAPGAGGSSDPPESFGMTGYADCLAAFLARIGFEPAHVSGLSFGGSLALASAQRHRTMPLSLTLISAYAGWAGSLGAAETRRRLEQASTLSRLAPDDVVAALLPTMFRAAVPRADVAAFTAAIAAFHPAGFRAMASASAEDLRGAMPAIEAPTLLLYGELDVRAPRVVAETMHAGIRNSRLVLVPGAGHVCTIEAPEFVNDHMRAFLHAHPRP